MVVMNQALTDCVEQIKFSKISKEIEGLSIC
jgi:hypothetical protein